MCLKVYVLGHDQSFGSTLDVNSEMTGSFGEFVGDIFYPPSYFCGQGEHSEDAAMQLTISRTY